MREFIGINQATKDGKTTYREQMLAAGYQESELIESEFPSVLYDVYEWFMDLQSTRASNGFSVMPIAWAEIKAYFDLKNINPESWQIETIKRLDSIALSIYRKK